MMLDPLYPCTLISRSFYNYAFTNEGKTAIYTLATAALSAGVAYADHRGYGAVAEIGTGLTLFLTGRVVLKTLRSFDGEESEELLTQKVSSLAKNFFFGITTLSIFCFGKALSRASQLLSFPGKIVTCAALAFAGRSLSDLSLSQLKNYSEVNEHLEGFFCLGRFTAISSFFQNMILKGISVSPYVVVYVLRMLDARPTLRDYLAQATPLPKYLPLVKSTKPPVSAAPAA
jgi:hypothetical protein